MYGMRVMHDLSWNKHVVLKILVSAIPNPGYIQYRKMFGNRFYVFTFHVLILE